MTRIDLPWTTKPPLTKNDTRRQGHHHAMRRKWDDALSHARWAIRAAKPTPLDRAHVTLHWRQPDRRRRDADGVALTLSACLDALVAEKVIPDDSWTHVPHVGITCHPPEPGTPAAMWLTISQAGGDDA